MAEEPSSKSVILTLYAHLGIHPGTVALKIFRAVCQGTRVAFCGARSTSLITEAEEFGLSLSVLVCNVGVVMPGSEVLGMAWGGNGLTHAF